MRAGTMHRAVMTGLHPSTIYFYQCAPGLRAYHAQLGDANMQPTHAWTCRSC